MCLNETTVIARSYVFITRVHNFTSNYCRDASDDGMIVWVYFQRSHCRVDFHEFAVVVLSVRRSEFVRKVSNRHGWSELRSRHICNTSHIILNTEEDKLNMLSRERESARERKRKRTEKADIVIISWPYVISLRIGKELNVLSGDRMCVCVRARVCSNN